MSHVNSVVISGLVTRDPELVEFPNGGGVAKFGLAVERSWMDKSTSERVSKTSFFDINVFGPFSNVIHAKVRTGDHLTVQGELEQERWQTDDQQNRSRVTINGRQIDGQALYRKADGSDTPPRKDPEAAPATSKPDTPSSSTASGSGQQQIPTEQSGQPNPSTQNAPQETGDDIPF